MFIRKLLLLTVFISLLSCEKKQEQQTAREINTSPVEVKDSLRMSRSELKNKVMGMLLGTAIGDAMGAPTEMWSREQIKSQYGYVADLDTMVRAPSAEGTWQYNLPAGGTTDDTRWKKLMAEFIIAQPAPATELKPVAFADHILRQYEEDIQQLKTTDGFDPEPFEDNLRRMAWLQEWALVAKPYAAGDMDGYSAALSRFYGGEMTCAGMLYLPAIGALYPAQPGQAYRAAFQLGFFDLGYARDISALTAAMVAAAMAAEPTPASVINVIRDIDPQHYFKSRLVGRAAYRILEEARNIVFQARQPTMQDMSSAKVEQSGRVIPDSIRKVQLQEAYRLLDERNQDMPFHAGEIHLINLTALLFCNFDFEESLAFVINYGRDNDTVAAVTGAILGAYWGADHLPPQLVQQVLTVNKERLGIDLEKLAEQLTNKIILSYPTW